MTKALADVGERLQCTLLSALRDGKVAVLVHSPSGASFANRRTLRLRVNAVQNLVAQGAGDDLLPHDDNMGDCCGARCTTVLDHFPLRTRAGRSQPAFLSHHFCAIDGNKKLHLS